jgi:hypothetical protein
LDQVLVVVDLEGVFDARPGQRLRQRPDEADDFFERAANAAAEQVLDALVEMIGLEIC